MEPNTMILLFLFLILLPESNGQNSSAQKPPTSNGYNCSTDRSNYPCQSYAFYRAGPEPGSYPPLLDLPSIADLFGLPRLTIARASNLTANTTALSPNQPLLIPLSCACGGAPNISYAAEHYQINPDDTYYRVSSYKFGNLTSYPAVISLNPSLQPLNLNVGVDVIFPVFCQCPNKNSSKTTLITYSFQPNDTFSNIASEFGTDVQSLISVNGPEKSVVPYLTILIPVSKVPPPVILNYAPLPPPPPPHVGNDNNSTVIGLSIGLGLMGLLCAALGLGLAWLWRGGYFGKRRREMGEAEGRGKYDDSKEVRKFERSVSDQKMMTDISEWLDKYKVYAVEELVEATAGFDQSRLIQGSVYRGVMDGEVYAIKKMKWNACDELKILQKVNHTNLVKLEGFCIEPDAGTCYLIYEFVENGSLSSWLHDHVRARALDWRTRLRIALDIAHGLQYVHEHTWPRVVHKDIKSSNVLLDSNMRAKIANFGLAKTGCNAVTTHIVGTQGYIAPEYLVDGLVTTKMDVFAYGVVLLELVTGREAMSGGGELLWMEVEGIFAKKDGRMEGRVLAWMDKAIVEERSNSMESVMNVMNIARACLQKDPAKRPSMVDVAYTLSKSDDMFSDFSEDGLMAGSGSDVAGR